jgi:hypothetical protein
MHANSCRIAEDQQPKCLHPGSVKGPIGEGVIEPKEPTP